MPKKTKKNSMRRPKRGIRWGYILLFLLIIIMMASLIGGVMVAGWVFGLAKELPEITADDLIMEQNSYVYDRYGRQLGMLHAGQNRDTVELADMPPFLIDAVLASEDIRFYDHNGVDFRSVMRAVMVDARDSIKARELTFTQGASTISMQLVRNVVADTKKSLDRKVKEALLAMEFEKNINSKDEILYLYMNMIYLGPRIYGFNSAASYYFNKELQDITLSEAALMVGILRNADYYSPYRHPERATNIRNTVLNSLIVFDEGKYGVKAAAAMKDELVVYDAPANTGTDYEHPWFVDHVLMEATSILRNMDMPPESLFTAGLHIYTTMDPKLQTAMENAYFDDDNFIESNTGDIIESAMAIVRPGTGEICGLVGGRRYGTKRGFNRATSIQRQPGSTIKPVIVYGPAVDKGYGPGYVLDDSPTGFIGNYEPGNSDHVYRGRVTMRQAIMGSRNTCAVKMLQTIGTQTGWSYAVNMGLPLSEEDAYYSSIALGGITRGVAPLDMAGAFATFANGGVYTEPYCVSRITDARGNTIYAVEPVQRRVVSAQTAYLITDMLISAVSGGTGTSARLSDWPTAGKTGTVELPSEDKDYAGKNGHKDVWFAGYTPELCGVVWMGYDNKLDADDKVQYLPRVYGGGPPAQLWKVVMTACHEGMDVKQFARPDGLVGITIDTKSGMLPSVLTPAEYIGSELYDARYVPTEESDIWKVVELCADSGNRLAGQYCPNKTSAVRMVLDLAEDEVISEKVPDYGLYAPSVYCSLHTVPQGDLSSVYICTDPRHGIERMLANMPGYGESGGCPQEFVALRYYGAAYLPTRYCGLEEHALEMAGAAYDPYNPFLPPTFGGGDNNQSVVADPGVTAPPVQSIPGGGYPKDEKGVPILQTPYSLATAPSSRGCLLSWAANNDPSSTIYIVRRIVDGDADNDLRFQVSGAYSFDDADVREGHIYTYNIYAYNAQYDVRSEWSQSISFSL